VENRPLRKGACLKIGNHKDIDPASIGVSLQLDDHFRWDDLVFGDVIENPNGWHSKRIGHVARRELDEIVSMPYRGNKVGASQLTTLQEE